MTKVTKESLAARIAELESGARSLKEDYTLAAYKMLLATMESEPDRKERKLLCSTDTARMRKVISASAGAEDEPAVPDELKEAAADFLTVLDEYPEQLVPINRDSAVVRALRAAMLNQK